MCLEKIKSFISQIENPCNKFSFNIQCIFFSFVNIYYGLIN